MLAPAEEHLLRVRLEAEALPDVVEATHLDPQKFIAKQTRYLPHQVKPPNHKIRVFTLSLL
jgi:hypothetical protein